MDNFTHSLAGWALGQTGLKIKSRKGLAALILGANAPDIDVFFGWVPWAPLATHRGVTHSLVGGVLVLPLLVTGLLLLFDRWQVARGDTFDSGLAMRPGWLLALATIGALTHPLLDLQNTYAVQLLSPFDRGWFHADSLFIIDVWIWSALAFAIWLSRRREKSGGHWRRPTTVALGVVIAYIGLNGAFTDVARTSLLEAACYNSETMFVGPPPVEFWRREVVWQSTADIPTGSRFRYGRGEYAVVSGARAELKEGPTRCGYRADRMVDPLVEEAIRRDPALRKFLAWSIMPVARIERGRCEAKVIVGDFRYGDPHGEGSRISHETLVPVSGKGC